MEPDLLASQVSFSFVCTNPGFLGIMKLAWVLAAFIAIVTYTAQLT